MKKITYNLNTIEYNDVDRDSIFAYAVQYRTMLVKKNKTDVKTVNDLKPAYDRMFKKAKELSDCAKKEVKATFIVEVKNLYRRYWKIYKHFNMKKKTKKKLRNLQLEEKLDELMMYVAILEAHLFFEYMSTKFEGRDYGVKSTLTYGNAKELGIYYQYGLLEIVKNNDIFGLVDMLAEAIDRPVTDSFSPARKMHRMFYIHVGKTNSGKTYDSIQKLIKAEKGTYLAPLRLLALEKFDEINAAGVKCSFSTGEEERIVEGATHVSATVEMADFNTVYDVAVIDECQMITDRNRGYAWSKAILGIQAYEICLCTAPEALNLLIKLIEDCGDYYKVVRHRRNTPLIMEEKAFTFDDVKKGDALVAFSKNRVNAIAAELMQRGIKVSVLYGALPYEARIKQFRNFTSGEADVMVCTDAIGMGLNLPIKRIVFMETYKFDGIERRPLNVSEIKQIAGRAGRRGIFDQGYVCAYSEQQNDYIARALKRKTPEMQAMCISFPKSVLLNDDIKLLKTMKAWKLLKVDGAYIKEDLEEAMSGVVSVKRIMDKYGYEVDQLEVFEMAALPVDRSDVGVNGLWKDYAHSKLRGDEKLDKPYMRSKRIDDLLSFSKKLDAYFICSRAWNMEYDAEWANEKRAECTRLINEKLIDDLKSRVGCCSVCGKELAWNSVSKNLCDACRSERMMMRAEIKE
jgi:hypothetical protein